MSTTPENPDQDLPQDLPATLPEVPEASEAAVSCADGEAAPPQATPAAPQVSTAEVAAELKQRFPALFTGPAKPLKLRIQADIQERAPGVFTKQGLSAFLRRHTGATSYLLAVAKGEHRFDLDGQPAGELTAEHREVANVELVRRREVTQTRRREEAQAHRQQHQQEFEARRQEHDARRERHQLLRDFERTTLTPANFGALKGLTADKLEALLAQARQEDAERPPQPPRDGPRGDRPMGDARRDGRRDGPGQGRGEGRSDTRRDARPPRRGPGPA